MLCKATHTMLGAHLQTPKPNQSPTFSWKHRSTPTELEKVTNNNTNKNTVNNSDAIITIYSPQDKAEMYMLMLTSSLFTVS